METYHYVIVGSGSAGCVLAWRLSQDPKTSVLVVEAGPPDTDYLLHLPRGFGKIVTAGNRHMSQYTVRRGGNRGEQIWLKGRTLGGSSSVNGLVYVRGRPEDYDSWEQRYGCAGWGWNTVGRAFKAIEGHELGEGEFRGAQGPLKISLQPTKYELTEALLEAGRGLGVPTVTDINDTSTEGGFGYQTRTIYKGRRMSAARAFLHPATKRPNLTVVANTQARRIIFEGGRAVGLELKDGAGLREVRAQEIILCAGALETPRLLQVSGVGPAEHLRALGVPVIANSPNVGQNLREHINLSMRYRLSHGSLSPQLRGPMLYWNVLRYQFGGKGPMTHASHEMVGFAKTRPQYDRPDAQFGFTLTSVTRDANGAMRIEDGHGLTVSQYYMRPKSQGSCLIQSADIDDAMLIDANYLSNENDRRHSVDAVRFAHRVVNQPALARFNPVYRGPVPDLNFDSDDEILSAFHEFGTSAFHVCGTVRMGADGEAPCDPQLRVRGVSGLRVMDASVMPLTPSGNTNGPVMAMAWRAADIILEGNHTDR